MEPGPPAAGAVVVPGDVVEEGRGNLKETREFIRKVKSPADVSSIVLESGGHNFNTWNREIPPGLVWMGGKLSAH